MLICECKYFEIRKVMKSLLPLLLIFLIYSCGNNQEESAKIPFEFSDISIEEKMEMALSKSYLSKLGIKDSTATYLIDFYRARNFKPKWINDSTLSSIGEQLIGVSKKVIQ